MATYSWDVRDKLRQAVVQAGSQQQTRSWTYDGLGFVRSETLPELGGQAILYETYDPRGNPLRVRDPRVRQRFTYDHAGRLVKVEEADASWQPLRTLREFVYADANGGGDWRKGKLWWQRAFTHCDDGTTVEVRQEYTYGGLLGVVSQELVTVSTSAGSQASLSVPFVQRYGYGAHTDQVEVHHDPHLAGTAQLPRRRVDYRYEKGMLVQVLPSYALEVAYWPSFLPREVRRVTSGVGVSPGFSQKLDIDPATMMTRPRRGYSAGVTAVSGGGGDWSAGVYVWDCSGNILRREADGVKADSEIYGYDLLSRFVSWTKGPVGETYGFDPFGNLTNDNDRSLASEAATNRLLHASYDGSASRAFLGSGAAWLLRGLKLETGAGRSLGSLAEVTAHGVADPKANR